MIFNNSMGEKDGRYSAVFEIAPPLDGAGRYLLPDAGPFGPLRPRWTYKAPKTFHASFISGAHRLPNGHTFITAGPQGRFFEVTPAGKIVWLR